VYGRMFCLTPNSGITHWVSYFIRPQTLQGRTIQEMQRSCIENRLYFKVRSSLRQFSCLPKYEITLYPVPGQQRLHVFLFVFRFVLLSMTCLNLPHLLSTWLLAQYTVVEFTCLIMAIETFCNYVLLLSYICFVVSDLGIKTGKQSHKMGTFYPSYLYIFYNTIERCVLERKDPLHLITVSLHYLVIYCQVKLLKQCLYISKFLSSNSYFLLEN